MVIFLLAGAGSGDVSPICDQSVNIESRERGNVCVTNDLPVLNAADT